MRIAFVAQPFDSVLPPHQNSIGLIIHHTAQRPAKDHDVSIILSRTSNDPDQDPHDGITYRFVSDGLDRSLQGVLAKFPRYVPEERIVRSRYYFRWYARGVARELARGQYDWVHILNFSQFLPLLRKAAPHSRFSLEMQCEWLTQFPAKEVRRRLRHVDLITGSSGYIAKLVRDAFPEFSDRCWTLHNGFDQDRFATAPISRSEERPHRILFVGRLSPEKAIHVLLDAMEMVLAERPDARLDLVGPQSTLPMSYIVGISEEPKVRDLARFYDGTVCDDYQSYLAARVAREPLAGKVRFVGTVPQAELPGWYGQADVLANPSFSESFGMSLVEGGATGLPAVATHVGGMPEIVVPGETGHLLDSGDAKGLAAALLDCLSSVERRDELGSAGRERALGTFTWEARSKRLLELFRDPTSQA